MARGGGGETHVMGVEFAESRGAFKSFRPAEDLKLMRCMRVHKKLLDILQFALEN